MQCLENRNLFKWLTILWATFIFAVSSTPHLSAPNISWHFRLDYLFHFSVYFLLGVFLVLWLQLHKVIIKLKKFIFVPLLAYLFAITDELHQIWIPGRTFAWQDMLCNILGISFAFILLPIGLSLLKKSKNKLISSRQ